MHSDLRSMYTVAAFVACGVACTKAVGHLVGVQGAADPCLTLAFAVLVYSAKVIAGHLSGTTPAKVPFEAQAEMSGKAGPYPDLLSNIGPHARKPIASAKRPVEDGASAQSPWSATLSSCFGCCTVRGDGDASDEVAPVVEPLNEASPRLVRSVSIDESDLESALKDLRSRLADLLGPPGVSSGGRGGDEVAVTAVQRFGGEQSCLVRFLRVRKYDVAAAEKMFRETVEFRRQSGANHILEDPEVQKVCDTIRPFFAASPSRFTPQGNIVINYKMAEFLGIWRRGIKEEDLQMFYISFMEQNLALQAKGREQAGCGSETELPACIEVYDLDGIGLKDLRCLAGVRMMMRILSIGQRFYPENLHSAVIMNIPSFASAPLQMIQSILDARTREKLRFSWGSGRSVDDVLNTEETEEPMKQASAQGKLL